MKLAVFIDPPRASDFGQQFLDQCVQLGEVRLAHVAFHDIAAFVDDVSGGRQLHVAPGPGNGTRVVDGDLKRQFAGLREIDNIAGGS